MPLSKQSLRKQIKKIDFDPKAFPTNVILEGLTQDAAVRMAIIHLRDSMVVENKQQQLIEAARMVMVAMELHEGQSARATSPA